MAQFFYLPRAIFAILGPPCGHAENFSYPGRLRVPSRQNFIRDRHTISS